MIRSTLAIALSLAAIPVLAHAQVAPAASDTPVAQDQAVPPAGPDARQANAEVAAQVALTSSATTVVNSAARRRYARDVAQYRAAQRARRTTIAIDAAVAERNEQAYASAMADWRLQVAACKRGRTRACNAPSPNPANY